MDSKTIGDKKRDLFKDFISFIPIITILALGLGVVNQVIYYYPFHFDILSYLEVNEIILGTINGFLQSILTFAVITLITQILLHKILYNRIKKLNITDPQDKRRMPAISLKTANRITILSVIVLTVVLIVMLISIHNSQILIDKEFKSRAQESKRMIEIFRKHQVTSPGLDQSLWDINISYTPMYIILITMYAGIVLSFLILIYFKHFYQQIYFERLEDKYVIFLTTVIMLFSYSVCNSLSNSMSVKNFSTYGTCVEIGSKKILSTESYLYIGRTKNFLFFHNAKNDHTDVYQNKDVSMLSLKDNTIHDVLNFIVDNRYAILKQSQIKFDSLYKAKLDSAKHLKPMVSDHHDDK